MTEDKKRKQNIRLAIGLGVFAIIVLFSSFRIWHNLLEASAR